MNQQHFILLFLWILYGLLHSFLADNHVKSRLQLSIGLSVAKYRVLYNLLAIGTLIIVLIFQFSLKSPVLLGNSLVKKIIAWLFLLVGARIMIICIGGYFRQLSGLGNNTGADLKTSGIHGLVRHPLYLGTFIFLGAVFLLFPVLSNLIAYGVIVLYTLVGMKLEEKKLLRQFGQAYREYQQRVPMIIPGLKEWNLKTFFF